MVKVRAVPMPTEGAPVRDQTVRLQNWSILDSGSRALSPILEGNLFGDPHTPPGSLVQVYNVTNYAIHRGWAASQTRLYLLGERKMS